MSLPPGFVYVGRLLPTLLSILGTTLVSARLVRKYTEVPVPPSYWFDVVACILAPIVLIGCRALYKGYQVRRRMAALDAVHPYTVYAKNEDMSKVYIGERLKRWVEAHDYIVRVSMYKNTVSRIITTEPDHIKAILATRFNDYEKGSEVGDSFYGLLGSGVFNSDGEMWKFHRSMTRPFFSRDRISDFDTFDMHSEEIIRKMKERLAEGHPIDFQDAVARFTLDSATEFLFGKKLGSISAPFPYPQSSPLGNDPSYLSHPSNRFVNAFLHGQEILVKRSRLGRLWRLVEFWKDNLTPHRKVIEETVVPIVQKAIAQKRSGEKVDTEDITFLANLVEHTEDVKIVVDELINILVAGRDTTSSTMAFAVYTLTQRPDIVARLREEILNKVGPNRRPTYDDIRDMKYLRAFINEVLRLYPVVPFNSRAAVVDTVLTSSAPGSKRYFVPAGTRLVYSVLVMHRRKDLWGPDAEEFDPDRFIDERLGKYMLANPFIFLPFNAGPRICLGQQFAYNEISFFLIRLLQNFSTFDLALDAQPEGSLPPPEWAGEEGVKGRDKVKFVSTLSMSIKGGLWVRMIPVN